ncbi:MAG: recombinase family protein [Firmicutes bacterium]|nr:recombinase family protein [Bacillota bacterium]
MNTVIYARYSSAGQTEQSIEGQLRVCKEYAERNGYFVIGEYVDQATTGTSDNRPQFQQMLQDARKGEFKYVLVYRLDRFARNKYHSVVHKHNLGKLGVKVISATEAISDSPEGKLLEGLLEMVAEMFSSNLSATVKRGMRESRLKGNFVGGSILYGYKVVDKKPVIDGEKAKAVRYMFEQYADGKRKVQIVAELNALGYRTNKGGLFTLNSFQYTLSNRKYIGVDEADGEENVVRYPRIIEDALFNKVQERLEITKKRPAANKADVSYLLSGKLLCKHCEASMFGISGTSGTKGEKHRYYACSRQYKFKTCDKKYNKKGELEIEIAYSTLRYVLNDLFYRGKKCFTPSHHRKENGRTGAFLKRPLCSEIQNCLRARPASYKRKNPCVHRKANQRRPQ